MALAIKGHIKIVQPPAAERAISNWASIQHCDEDTGCCNKFPKVCDVIFRGVEFRKRWIGSIKRPPMKASDCFYVIVGRRSNFHDMITSPLGGNPQPPPIALGAFGHVRTLQTPCC